MDCREILSRMVLQQNPRPLHLAQLAKENRGGIADQENRIIPRMSTRDATAIAANATNFASTTTSGLDPRLHSDVWRCETCRRRSSGGRHAIRVSRIKEVHAR